MAMMRYVKATVKRVVDADKVSKIIVCKDSGQVKEEPDEEESDEERDGRKDGDKAAKRPD